jgi:hypothetical protein
MLDKIFNSQTRVKVLSLFSRTENGRYYVQEAARLTETDPASIHRELNTLEEIGILKSQMEGKQKYFSLVPNNPYWKPIQQLIEIHKDKQKDKWLYLGLGKDLYPLINYSSITLKTNKPVLKDLGVEQTHLDFAGQTTSAGMHLWMKEDNIQPALTVFQNILRQKPNLILNIRQKASSAAKELTDFVCTWQEINLTDLSIAEIAQELEKFSEKLGVLDGFHWLQTCLDYNQRSIDTELISILESLDIPDPISSFAILTTPLEETTADKEYQNLLHILQEIEKDKKALTYFQTSETRIIKRSLWNKHTTIDHLIRQHTQEFGYLGYGRKGPAWDEGYYIETIKSLITDSTSASNLLSKISQRQNHLKSLQNQLQSHLSNQTAATFEAYRSCISAKIERKETTYFAFERLLDILSILSGKINISIDLLQLMYAADLHALKKGKLDEKDLQKRLPTHLHLVQNNKEQILVEPEASQFMANHPMPYSSTVSPLNLFGKCSVAGRVRGQNMLLHQKNLSTIAGTTIITTNQTDFLRYEQLLNQNIESIVGLIILGSFEPTNPAIIFSRKYGIPCITIDASYENFFATTFIDLDATHAKATLIEM